MDADVVYVCATLWWQLIEPPILSHSLSWLFSFPRNLVEVADIIASWKLLLVCCSLFEYYSKTEKDIDTVGLKVLPERRHSALQYLKKKKSVTIGIQT